MKTTQRVLFLLAFLALTIQTVRHVYLRYFISTQSVLDKYEQPLKEEIIKAQSLGELLAKYDKARDQVNNFESGKTKEELKEINKFEIEPYKSEMKLKKAIEDWEAKSKEMRELRFYWTIGIILMLIGFIIYFSWSHWLGVAFIITSFSEMIYWTSPTFFGSSSIESDHLLTQKIICSLVSLLFLLIVSKFLGILKNDPE